MMNVMLDLETLGLKPGCVILSIGAVPFNTQDQLKRGLRFYEKIKLKSSLDYGLRIDPKTEKWWDQQPAEAKAEALSGELPLYAILSRFNTFLYHLDQPVHLWGNAASFDLKILEKAYEACDMKIPWDFRNERCFRTLKTLFPQVPAPAFVGVKHTAIADAEHQALHAEAITNYLAMRGVQLP